MDVVKVILEKSSVVEIEMQDALGQKPDSMAVKAGNFEIGRMIIETVKAKKAALASG